MTSLVATSYKLLTSAKVVFWDFDGVIKDSAKVKVQAYVDMFDEHGTQIQSKIRSSYNNEGGKSRFQLIPLFYQDIVGMSLTTDQLNQKLNLYSNMVVDRVIQSDYIPGVLEYLEYNFKKQKFLIVTNTPKVEIDDILETLGIDIYFEAVFGAPDLKKDVIRNFLRAHDTSYKHCVFVGDSEGDFMAAHANAVPFIYRGADDAGYYQYQLPHFQFDWM